MHNRNLYVVTCISNPIRYKSRYNLYRHFAKHMEDSGAILYTAELATGKREHAVTEHGHHRHLQLRSYDELWHKENMLNLAMRHLPHDWEYVAWIDADVQFSRPDWVNETIEQLQHYDFVQLFSHATDLSPMYEPMKTHSGFVYDWYHNPESVAKGGYATFSHPGFAWAARRDALDSVGGLIDHSILGSGDRHMACAMIQKVEHSYNNKVNDNYKSMCLDWQDRVQKYSKGNVGYVGGSINHFWHGSKNNRGYSSRWKILIDNDFNPALDIFRDTQGLYRLTDEKPSLRDAIRKYFRSRHENCIYTGDYKLLP